MPYLRFSHARHQYVCAECRSVIAPGEAYFRDEPFPIARVRGEKKVRQLCAVCVLGEADAQELHDSLTATGQLPLDFEINEQGFMRFPPLVQVVDITPDIVRLLAQEPDQLREMGPEFFEKLVCNRLDAMGFDVQRVGSSTFHKDGGIDIIAVPREAVFPSLIAVQAKHTSLPGRKVGPQPVRDLIGAVNLHGLNMGLLVTNTTFTPDARWVAEKQPVLTRLQDIEDLRSWLRDEFLRDSQWKYMPKELVLCSGTVVRLR